MYKNHKIIFFLGFIVLFIISLLLKLDYSVIASEGATVISIVLAIYMTSFSSLISSELAEKMKNKEDSFVPGKSQLGVLRTYLNLAVAIGILNIVLGCMVLLYEDILGKIDKDVLNKFSNIVNGISSLSKVDEKFLGGLFDAAYNVLSSAAFSTFGLNLMLMYLLYKFMVNKTTLEQIKN